MQSSRNEVLRQIVTHRVKLLALTDQLAAGDLGTLAKDAQDSADRLTALLHVAPLETRREIDELVSKFENLRSWLTTD